MVKEYIISLFQDIYICVFLCIIQVYDDLQKGNEAIVLSPFNLRNIQSRLNVIII